MKNFSLFIDLAFTHLIPVAAQQKTPKEAFLEKWENSKNYLLEIAEAMPDAYYDFKPSERQMTFGKQLLHIRRNMNWLGGRYFGMEELASSELEDSKAGIIDGLISSFDSVKDAVAATPEKDLTTTVEFFAGDKSKLQILNLLKQLSEGEKK